MTRDESKCHIEYPMLKNKLLCGRRRGAMYYVWTKLERVTCAACLKRARAMPEVFKNSLVPKDGMK